MTITTSSLVCAGAEAIDFVSDRIQAGLAKMRPPPFQNLREQAAARQGDR
jgi:hypothetical protein